MEIKVGDKFFYKGIDPDHSFDFIVFGINKRNFDIIIDRDENPSLWKLKSDEIKLCERVSDDN